MRKLASIQKVVDIGPIKGADRIERIDILSWESVSSKGTFKPEDLVVYFEIDSWLPPHDAYNDFMALTKMKVKTRKFKKQISQGLALPISDFPELAGKTWKEGDDVTELLKVRKWIPGGPDKAIKRQNVGKPKPWYWKMVLKYNWGRKLFYYIYGKGGHNFPSHLVSHTDETRIQAAPGLLKQAAKEEDKLGLYCAEKVDGQSATYVLDKPKGILRKRAFIIASRNYIKSPNDGSNWSVIAKKYSIEDILRKEYSQENWYAIQGEVIGQGIQKNKYNRNELELYIFNVFNVKEQTYLHLDAIKEFCKRNNLQTVPILDENYSVEGKTTKDIMVECAGQSKLYPTKREGIVVRAKQGKKVSFKAVDPKFLLKHGE